MSAEETLIQVRKDKHQQLNGGSYPLLTPGNYSSIHHLLDTMVDPPPPVSLEPKELGMDVHIHGRITNFRKSGGITFLKVMDGTGSIQVIASKSVYDKYEELKLWDLGDIVEVHGRPCTSKTGEPSVLLMHAWVLSKSHRPPPEKFVGIADTELKYRKRYLDLMSSEESRALFTIRSEIVRALREYMHRYGFMEVETSTLNTISSGANAKPFTTHHNALETDLFLRIAPELYLKRLLVGGFEKVFEIGRAYRNEGISTRHNPEFSILEFYQAYGNFRQLVDMGSEILTYVDERVSSNLMATGSFAYRYYRKWSEERTFTLRKTEVVSMHQAVINGLNRAGMSMQGDGQVPHMLDEPDKKARQDRIDVKALTYELSQVKTWGQRLAIYFEHIAEPFLTEDYRWKVSEEKSYSVPVFITDYPVEICPLARPKKESPHLCDRYELFVDGRELSNAFQELNDPDDQARKFQAQLETNQKDAMGYDADYVEALEHGMPPAIGFGMGIDRLVMLLTNSASIKDVILFPTLKPIK